MGASEDAWAWQYAIDNGFFDTPQARAEALQRQQIEQEAEYNRLMRPILLRNMGLVEDKDENGAMILRPMTEEEKIAGMTDEQKSAYEVEKLVAERQAKAAKGELDVPTYIQDELGRQKTAQNSLLSQRLGAKGASLSTAGINTKVNQMGNETGVKSAYQHGQESQGMGLLGQYSSYLGNQTGANQNLYGGFSNAGMGIIPMAQTAVQPYSYANQLMNENSQINRQRTNAAINGVASGIGTAASIYLNRGGGGS